MERCNYHISITFEIQNFDGRSQQKLCTDNNYTVQIIIQKTLKWSDERPLMYIIAPFKIMGRKLESL